MGLKSGRICVDVKLHPFHATSPALPELAPGAWADLIAPNQPDEPGTPQNRAAGILLAEPHFLQVSDSQW